MCTIIPRCIHELHLFNAIFIMVYEMSVVFTVCCVAPPGVRNEIRYQLTNPLNVICFRTDILRPSYNPSSGSSFLLCQSWYRRFVSFPSPFFFSKNESFFVISAIKNLLSAKNYLTSFHIRFDKRNIYNLWFLWRLNSEKIGTRRLISRANFRMLKKSRDFYAYQSVRVSLEISRCPAL